jgi:hypothetical protein
MGSIRIHIDVAPDGTITGKAPPGLKPGPHAAAVAAEAPPRARAAGKLELPVHDCGPWPEGLSLRREDIYGDDGR